MTGAPEAGEALAAERERAPGSPSTPHLVRDYHQRSKHRPQRYAAGPETLDWDAQPAPFRRWAGAGATALPLVADTLPTRWDELPAGVPALPLARRSVAALFELSFALTAWKQQGPDRWALRATPSSGNLHPTEAYLLTEGVAGLADGLHHYAACDHALEQRAQPPAQAQRPGVNPPPRLWLGLSSIHWREAWKYGERAFRYCQLDVGHALGALRYAAATLGWQARVVSGIGHADLAALLGLDRAADFGCAEAEEPELLVQLGPALPPTGQRPAAWPPGTLWHGRASLLDARPMYRWPVIAEVAAATRGAGESQASAAAAASAAGIVAAGAAAQVPATAASAAARPTPAPRPGRRASPPAPTPAPSATLPPAPLGSLPAARLIRQRRSAQQFDRRVPMPAAAFWRIAAALMPGSSLPWDAWPQAPRVHPVFFLHRVSGLAAGAYVLPRSAEGAVLLAEALQGQRPWQPVPEAPRGLPLLRIAEHPALAGTLRTLSCHQAIAADAPLVLSLLGEFDGAIDSQPWRYRQLYQEAGLLGQLLYLQAEAEGQRGTGIGCYFDDAVHDLLGLRGTPLQVLYHFTIGSPVTDPRITTEAPYAERRTPIAPD